MPKPRKRHSRPKEPLHLKKLLIGGLLILAGIIFFIIPSLRPVNNHPKETATVIKTAANPGGPFQIDSQFLQGKESLQPPLRILIPSLSMDLPIIEAPIVNGYWELSETTASHGVGSANPGENGNIVIFAHARQELFGPLRNIKVDSLIYILTKDRWHRYQVLTTKEVLPSEIEVIKPTAEETLTVYTCTGFLDTKRLIVVAKPYHP